MINPNHRVLDLKARRVAWRTFEMSSPDPHCFGRKLEDVVADYIEFAQHLAVEMSQNLYDHMIGEYEFVVGSDDICVQRRSRDALLNSLRGEYKLRDDDVLLHTGTIESPVFLYQIMEYYEELWYCEPERLGRRYVRNILFLICARIKHCSEIKDDILAAYQAKRELLIVRMAQVRDSQSLF